MDNKVLDEAVEVALSAVAALDDDAWPDDYDADDRRVAREAMRAALLAGMRVLLGEPVAWQYRFNHPLPSGGMCEWHTCDLAYANTLPRVAYDVRPVYAPSLGEGDGR